MLKKIILLTFFLLPTAALSAKEYSFLELQQLAINENPRLKSMKYQTDMLKHRVAVSKSLDDPKLKIAINNLPINNFSLREEEMTSKEISLSQMIPLGGKLDIKERSAIKDYYKALEIYKREKIELLHQLRSAVYELFYLDEIIKINEEQKRYFDILIESQSLAVKAGKGSLSNVLKANMEKNMIDEEIITIKQKRVEMISKIKYLAGI